jgi:hypothetical protein
MPLMTKNFLKSKAADVFWRNIQLIGCNQISLEYWSCHLSLNNWQVPYLVVWSMLIRCLFRISARKVHSHVHKSRLLFALLSYMNLAHTLSHFIDFLFNIMLLSTLVILKWSFSWRFSNLFLGVTYFCLLCMMHVLSVSASLFSSS